MILGIYIYIILWNTFIVALFFTTMEYVLCTFEANGMVCGE